MSLAVALLDYDNLVRSPERSPADVEYNLIALSEILVGEAKAVSPTVSELQLRVYGGWIDEQSGYSTRGQSMLAALPVVRTRKKGVRILPILVTTLVGDNPRVLKGSIRNTTPPRQKMVDVMLGVDAVAFAIEGERSILFATDDDDLVPAVLACRLRTRRPISVVRLRDAGTACNDDLYASSSIGITTIRGA